MFVSHDRPAPSSKEELGPDPARLADTVVPHYETEVGERRSRPISKRREQQ
jgi:hypothetical protein